ncbi:MAG: AAA family ATPase, partial [Rhabdochlamydiaceae bacterium]
MMLDFWKSIKTKVLIQADNDGRTQHIIITGCSGVGKSTLAKLLSKLINLPIHQIDDDPLWKENESITDAKNRFCEGTKDCEKYQSLLKKLIRRAVEKQNPHILEGCQFLISPNKWRGHRVVLLDVDEDTVVKQRLKRDSENGKLERDGKEKREKKARELYKRLKPLVEEAKKNPGVEVISPHEFGVFLAKIKGGGSGTKALDKQSGVIPTNFDTAKKVDLITLPEGISGTNCSNCSFVTSIKDGKHFCAHPRVQLEVNNRNCCALWDNKGALRDWGKKTLSSNDKKLGSIRPSPFLRYVKKGLNWYTKDEGEKKERGDTKTPVQEIPQISDIENPLAHTQEVVSSESLDLSHPEETRQTESPRVEKSKTAKIKLPKQVPASPFVTIPPKNEEVQTPPPKKTPIAKPIVKKRPEGGGGSGYKKVREDWIGSGNKLRALFDDLMVDFTTDKNKDKLQEAWEKVKKAFSKSVEEQEGSGEQDYDKIYNAALDRVDEVLEPFVDEFEKERGTQNERQEGTEE